MQAVDTVPESEGQRLLHDLRQPLNVIRLAAASIGRRLSDSLPAEEAEFLARKLARIEEQVTKADRLIDGASGSGQSGVP